MIKFQYIYEKKTMTSHYFTAFGEKPVSEKTDEGIAFWGIKIVYSFY
jgi:hypothetical protein